ncbi:MAG: hypothetical protein JEY99_21840 [Spirochaetales bacterium]|nr:hypothetical protein [Spirochaetales bacterium]
MSIKNEDYLEVSKKKGVEYTTDIPGVGQLHVQNPDGFISKAELNGEAISIYRAATLLSNEDDIRKNYLEF